MNSASKVLYSRIGLPSVAVLGLLWLDCGSSVSGSVNRSDLFNRDVTMPGDGLYWANGDSLWGSQLTSAILNSSIPMSRLNDMVLRVVAAWYQLGQNDSSKFPPSPPLGDGGPNFSSWTNDEEGLFHHGSGEGERGIVNKFIDVQADHGDLIREIGAEAITLLKNDDGVLPLSRDGLESRGGAAGKFRVAIIGEDAGEGKGPNACPDRGCNQGTLVTIYMR